MTVKEIVQELNLEVKSANSNLDKLVSGGYVSDLLSDVMANARKDNLWVTLQIHQNIVAVATLKELTGIVIVNGRIPEDEVIEKAEAENMPILLAKLSAFEIVGRLYKLGIKGVGDAKEL